MRIRLFQFAYQTLGILPLGVGGTVIARFGKAAGALQKAQAVIVAPCLDIVLSDVIQRTDQLHALIVGAVELGHHRLHLTAPEHTHQNRFDHVVIVMAEGDLVATELLRLFIQPAAAHSGAQITRRLFDFIHRVEDRDIKNGDRYAHHAGVALDHQAIQLIIPRIHDEEYQLERKLIMALEFLKELCHQHTVLAARNTHGDLIPRLYHVELDDRLREAMKDILLEAAAFGKALLDLAGAFLSLTVGSELCFIFICQIRTAVIVQGGYPLAHGTPPDFPLSLKYTLFIFYRKERFPSTRYEKYQHILTIGFLPHMKTAPRFTARRCQRYIRC